MVMESVENVFLTLTRMHRLLVATKRDTNRRMDFLEYAIGYTEDIIRLSRSGGDSDHIHTDPPFLYECMFLCKESLRILQQTEQVLAIAARLRECKRRLLRYPMLEYAFCSIHSSRCTCKRVF